MKHLGIETWLSFLIACFFFPPPVDADPLDNWRWRSPLPQGNHLNAAAFGKDTIVAVGDTGTIITSQDGINWTVRSAPTSSNLTGIAYGNDTFVAVGDSAICTSPDGISWTKSPLSGTELTAIAYGNNGFVAVGKFSKSIITSPDGVTWEHHYVPGYSAEPFEASVSFTRVTYSDNAFFAMGWVDCYGWCNFTGNEPPVIYSSPDGVAWTGPLESSQYPSLAGDGYGVVYGNGVYFKQPDYLSFSVSSDNVVWREVSLPGLTFDLGQKSYFIKGNFYVFGGYGYIATSPDGFNWTLVTSRPFKPLREVAFGNGVWAAISDHVIYTSTDGISWTPQYSTDGTGPDLVGIAYGNNRFVVVGLYHALLTSPDGREWIKTPSGLELKAVAFGNGLFVGASDDHNLLTSPDGIDWTVRASYPPIQYTGTRFYRIAFGNGIFAAIGSDTEQEKDVVYTSSDGESWTAHMLDTGERFYVINDICYGDNKFLIVGNSGYVYSSTDGDNWSAMQAGPSSPGGGFLFMDRYGVAYGDGSFVSVGGYAKADIFSSPDGITWTRRESLVSDVLNYVASVNHTFLVGSASGDVLQSARFDVPTPNPFTFVDQTNVPLSTVLTSNAVTVSGMNAAAPISVIDGTYSINGGAYTDADGIVNNGDTVTVRQTSSGSYSATTNATLTFGGAFATFSVTTGEAPISLRVSRSGPGSGTIASTSPGIDCGVDCYESYATGTSVTLTAQPAEGSAFAGWSDGSCPGIGPCTLQVDGKRSVAATFIDKYGDMNGDGAATMIDAILALQFATGINPPYELNLGADVNHDDMIGLEEIVYILQKTAGMR